MDLRLYYQKIREASSKIADAFPVVVSKETADGGKDGILNEVTRAIAAKMLVEGLARLASAEESAALRQEQAARRAATGGGGPAHRHAGSAAVAGRPTT